MATVVKVDFSNAKHAEDLVRLLDTYAQDPTGGGRALPEEVKSTLVDKLQAVPTALSYLAYEGEEAVGLANCFQGFSTFEAKPTLAVHDIFVCVASRGKGVCRSLMAAVEEEGKTLGCCRVTMEILSAQRPAVGLGLSQFLLAGRTPIPVGFSKFLLNQGFGGAIHMDKAL